MHVVSALIRKAHAERGAQPAIRVILMLRKLLVQPGVHEPGPVVGIESVRVRRARPAGFAAIEIGLRRVGKHHAQVVRARQAVNQRTRFDFNRQ